MYELFECRTYSIDLYTLYWRRSLGTEFEQFEFYAF